MFSVDSKIILPLQLYFFLSLIKKHPIIITLYLISLTRFFFYFYNRHRSVCAKVPCLFVWNSEITFNSTFYRSIWHTYVLPIEMYGTIASGKFIHTLTKQGVNIILNAEYKTLIFVSEIDLLQSV